jgi:hypothetical protein
MQQLHAPRAQDPNAATHTRQAFHKPHASMGTTGHWVHLLGMLSPLIIPEFISEPSRQSRLIRISAIGTAVLSEALWSARIHREREREREECAMR